MIFVRNTIYISTTVEATLPCAGLLSLRLVHNLTAKYEEKRDVYELCEEKSKRNVRVTP